MKNLIKFFIATPEGWAAIMAVTLYYKDQHQEAYAFYGVLLLCWALHILGDRIVKAIQGPKPEPEPGVSLKDLDFGDVWTQPNRVSKP